MLVIRSKTVSDLQKRFPELQTELRGLVAQESERVKKEERSVGDGSKGGAVSSGSKRRGGWSVASQKEGRLVSSGSKGREVGQ